MLGILVPLRGKYAPFFRPAGIYWLIAAYTFKMGDKNRDVSPRVVIQRAYIGNKNSKTKEAQNKEAVCVKHYSVDLAYCWGDFSSETNKET